MALALPTGRRGQILALAITVLTAALLWLAAIAPLLDTYNERDETLRRQLALGRRMEALVRTLPGLREQATSALRAERETSALLPGASDPLAAAALQQRLDELARSADLRIGSVEIIPAQASGAFRAVGLRVTLHAPYRNIVVLLQSLAQSDIPMVVSDLSIRGPSGIVRDPDPSVDGSFTVLALRASAGAAPEAGPPAKPDQP